VASYFRVFWRKQRQIQRLPVAFDTAPPAPAGEPVSAWTPYFKRTDNATHRRVPEENPHNPEYPATPAVPFFIAAVDPATSIKRRDIRRQRIPSPFHYNKPLTTRITHLTANVLYGQGPPAARITHLTVQVLYRAPKSQGHPETNPPKKGKKKKWGYITGDTSTARRLIRLPQLDVFTPTPPGFFEGQWPSHRPPPTFRTSFKRQIQSLPPLWEYPPTPPAVFPFAALDLLLRANRTAFQRQIQTLPQLDERPVTPPGFRWPRPPFPTFKVEFVRTRRELAHNPDYPATPAGFRWPRPPMPTFKVSFTRTLQTLAHNPIYPATPPGFFEGFFPAPIRLKRIPVTYGREAQRPLELDERPPTPAGFFDGFWPGSKAVESLFVSFDTALQKIPELDRYKPPPVSDENYAGYTPVLTFRVSFTRTLQVLAIPPEYPPTPPGFFAGFYPAAERIDSFTWSFQRTIQRIELDERPPTPPGFFEGFFPAPFRVKRIPTTYGREAQRVLNPHVYPPTPAGFFDGFWPASKLPPTFRIEFTRVIQAVLIPPVYPETPVSAEDYPALTPVLKANRVDFTRTLQALELNEYPETPPGFFEGFFPAPVRLKRIPLTYHRESQSPLELNERPPTPPRFFEGFWPASKPFPTLKVSFDRTLQTLPPHDQWSITPPGFFEGFFPAPFRVKRIPVTYHREAQRVLNPHVYPATPPGFFEGHWPAPVPMPTHRVAFTRTLQILGIPPEYPETPVSAEDYPGLTPVLKANRISFERNIQAVELDERPPTPPGFFEGFFPAPVRLKRIPITYHRESQVPLELNERPPTPVGFFDGFYPGSKRVESFKVSFERVLQTPLEINVYPPPPVSAEDYAAFTPVAKFSWSYQRTLQTLELNERPETPPGFRWPRPSMPTHRTAFARRLQLLPQLDERPETPAPTPPQPRVESFNVSFTRARQELAHNPIYPPTQAGFFDGFWPGSRRVEPLNRAFERHLVTLPQHDEWAQIPPVPGLTAFFRVKDANKSAFSRSLLVPPVHNEYPETPPSIIEGMAMWPAMPIYRRDITRSLQPVWDPSAIIGKPVFIPHDEDCKIWFAECAPTLWTADSTWITWEADPICD
jgi:hypothetical protein